MNAQTPPSNFPHWMLAEIYEQPEAIRRTLAGYVQKAAFRREITEPISAWLRAQSQLVIAASGSSRHAGLVAEVLLEDITPFPVDVEYASEYSFRMPNTASPAGVVVISQSGETGDTLLALRRSSQAGQSTLAISNVPGSTMLREATVAMPTFAGPERAVPATKSFTAQLLVVELLSLLAAEVHETLSAPAIKARLAALEHLPARMEPQLPRWQAQAEAAAQQMQDAHSFLFCGRGLHYPLAREGALKLKESAYVHAEAYPSGELRHGPTALVGPEIPVVLLATVDRNDAGSVQRYESALGLMHELRERGGRLLGVADADDAEVASGSDALFTVEPAPEALAPICEVIPLQLFAYCFAAQRGVDVDRPRNLVKAVMAL